MKYYLFTAPHRCPPCRALENLLEKVFNWKEKIEYINADAMNDKQMELANKLSLRRLPSLSTDDNMINGDYIELYKKIKEICTSE